MTAVAEVNPVPSRCGGSNPARQSIGPEDVLPRLEGLELRIPLTGELPVITRKRRCRPSEAASPTATAEARRTGMRQVITHCACRTTRGDVDLGSFTVNLPWF